MANHNIVTRITKYGKGGTRQQFLAVAATSMIGLLTTSSSSNNNSAIKEEDSSRQLLSIKRANIDTNNSIPATSSGSRRRIIHNSINNSLSNSMVVDPCLCERLTQQVRDDDQQFTSNPRPQSVSTQDKIALVRKHRTLRLLDKLKTEASVDSKYDWNKDYVVRYIVK